MIHLTRVGEDEHTPSLKCDLCGAELMFHITLHDDELLTADDHDGMRERTRDAGWVHLVNAAPVGPRERDLCSRCVALKLEPIPHS